MHAVLTHMLPARHLSTRYLTLACAALLFSSPSHGAITSGAVTGGQSFDNGGTFELIAAPATLGNNAFEDDNVRGFDEVQNLVLAENLILDRPSPDADANVLAPGSVVSSHYVIYDPSSTTTVVGTVSFDAPVLGVITSNPRFNETDSLLGNPGTLYIIGSQELENPDTITISGNTVTYSMQTNSPGDAMRVITGTDPIFAVNVCDGADQTLVGVITGGDALSNGGRFRQLCDPIGPVGNDNFDSYDLFAFEEQQAVELAAPLAIDSTTSIAAGEFVSSFYVIWDPVPSNRVDATITFPDTIIGVITERDELQLSEFLGDASATYLNPTELGLEGTDSFSVNGADLTISFRAGTPGDSVRVLLGSASPSLNINICAPQDVTLSGSVTGGSAASAGGVFTQLCEPIGPVGNDNFQSNDLFAFEELQDVPLATALDLDEPAMTTLEAGTLVSSYYVAFDPGTTRSIVGTVTFPNDIVGLATSTAPLTDTDYLGNTTGVYLNPSLRGLESVDSASFSGDTLSVSFDADSPGDYIRVLVAGNDLDSDGIADATDNCTLVANTAQTDGDGDGYGNVCDADLNNDCIVNVVDLGILRTVFFSADLQADLNDDGVVNVVDLGIMRTLFFAPPGPSGITDSCAN